MPEDNAEIDALVRAIEEVQERIEGHLKIRYSETRTRDDLIRPLLSALGWEGPSVITSEYSITRGFRPQKADYALHEPDQTKNPVAFIEAKRMNVDLTDDHIQQVIGYARSRNVKYIGLTNGDRWIFYNRDVDRPVLNISIRRDSARSCAVELLGLVKLLGFKRCEETADQGAASNTRDPNLVTATPIQQFIGGIRAAVSHESAPAVGVRNVLAWLGLFFMLGGIVGYGIGFRAAQPVLQGFIGPLGAIALLILVLVVAALVLLRRPWRRMSLSWFSVEGDVRKTLIWSCCGSFGGIIGYIIGYAVGIRTAQPIYDILEIVGVIFLYVVFSAVMIAIVLGVVRDSRRSSRGGRT